MAQFTGSLKEFNDFIGPIARNIVCNISRKHKKNTSCNHQGCSKRKNLEAAHIKGKERTTIIAQILIDYQIGNEDMYQVDLHEFKEKFLEAHDPIDSVIIPLCKQHHIEYDKEHKIQQESPVFLEDFTDSNYTLQELEQLEEQDFQALNKAYNKLGNSIQAKTQICQKLGIDTIQASFSAISTSNNLWNFDVNKEKFKNDFTFIFYNQENNTYKTSTIKAGSLDLTKFPKKNENVIRFFVGRNYTDKSGYKFAVL